MAAMEEALVTRVTSGVAVAALIGTRMYPLVVPQDVALPAIAYQRISSKPIMAHGGPVGLTRARVQLTLVGRSYAEVKELADAVRARLNGLRGTVGGVMIEAIILDNEADDDIPDAAARPVVDSKLVFQDYLVMFLDPE